jgi:lipoprotein-anchoring transpeptidase ErfK/SrfK
VTEYEIKAADVKGPFVDKIPKDFEKMAELQRLSYRSLREALAEKFHMSQDLLKALNPKTALDEAGATIVVANVVREPDRRGRKDPNTGARSDSNNGARAEHRTSGAKPARIEVNKSERSVQVLAEDGSLIAYYPASIGSREKPAPSGMFEVRAIAQRPRNRLRSPPGRTTR